jgi:hypothetical protein
LTTECQQQGRVAGNVIEKELKGRVYYNLNDVEILDKEALQRVWEEKSVELGEESESEEIFLKS